MVFMWNVCEATLAITMDTDKIILGLSISDAKYNALMQELINTYHFDGIRDVRVNMVKHPRIVIDSTYVLLLVRQDNLFEPSWWDRMINLKKISKNMTQESRDTFAFAYDSYVKSSYITMLLFAIESGFRTLYLSVFGEDPPFNFSKSIVSYCVSLASMTSMISLNLPALLGIRFTMAACSINLISQYFGEKGYTRSNKANLW
jgi:hypothetical protein